ncbi:hypothetical protein [Myxacorys almedinensis]|uniref:Type II secretion system protein GspE N-terminal domain-containing protein n=1 Tax=Myxacorys almedinensis A TaxID=2690445 RepID=A0A8J8CKI9_9CYAN|nr:hypothetical protein [Myxacorys almedinensis]NDJ19594.1 hypothetical protein [Myxacorys almedinensis A]
MLASLSDSQTPLRRNRHSNFSPHLAHLVLSVDLEGTVDVDTKTAFQLVDRVLPFEACLYHQVLPLSLEEGCLRLGMVTLEDATALEYVRRLVGFMNYTLAPQSISSESHYGAMSAYLHYSQERQNASFQPQSPPAEGATSDIQEKIAPKATIDFHAKETYIVASPDELDYEAASDAPSLSLVPSQGDGAALLTPLPDQGVALESALPTLEVSTQHLNSAVEILAQLPPAQLLQELLGRILLDGIGRLYLERQATHGRVLWSQNGVLQSVINELPLPAFQGLLDELKQLTHLPMTPLRDVKQVEIERLCQKNRVLLRLRMTPNMDGEAATLQILRGAALKFYQKQQLTNLSRDALCIAKELQKKLSELRDRRAQAKLSLPSDSSAVLPNLSQVLQIVEQQLTDLQDLN